MEFKVNSKELEKLLSKLYPAVPSRSPISQLENFLMEIKDGKLTAYASDLEVALKASLNIVSEENIKFAIPAKLIYDMVKTFSDTTIHFQFTDNGKINVTTDKGKYKISYLDADEYPELPSFSTDDVENIEKFSINGLDLKYIFDKTYFALSKDEVRPAMNGVFFQMGEEGLKNVATDGHRLVFINKKNAEFSYNAEFIVPERAVSILMKSLDDSDVTLYFKKEGSSTVSFVLNDVELVTRLIDKKYPDYRAVIPAENDNLLKISLKDLQDAIKRMMLFTTSSNTRRVKLSITNNNLEISAEDVDKGASGTENVICEYSGEPMDIGFNSVYLNEVLSHMPSESDILFKLYNPTKAAILEPEKKKDNFDLLMLLMPVRLNN